MRVNFLKTIIIITCLLFSKTVILNFVEIFMRFTLFLNVKIKLCFTFKKKIRPEETCVEDYGTDRQPDDDKKKKKIARLIKRIRFFFFLDSSSNIRMVYNRLLKVILQIGNPRSMCQTTRTTPETDFTNR